MDKKEETVVVDHVALNAPPAVSPTNDDDTIPLQESDLLPTPVDGVPLRGLPPELKQSVQPEQRTQVSVLPVRPKSNPRKVVFDRPTQPEQGLYKPMTVDRKLDEVNPLPSEPNHTGHRSGWWFVPLYVGLVAVIALLLLQHCNGGGVETSDISGVVLADGDKTRAMLGDNGPIVTAIVTDGNSTRAMLGDDGPIVTAVNQYTVRVEAFLGDDGALRTILKEFKEALEGNNREIVKIGRKIDRQEELEILRHQMTQDYLLSLDMKSNRTVEGVDQLLTRGERPITVPVRVVVPRTKTVVVEK